MKQEKSIQLAVDECGSITELARRLNVSPQAVHAWLHKIRPVPAARVLGIENATGGAVTRHEIRPDLYPVEK